MLKITEIPLFVEAGLEVIPTEVTPNVMNYQEGVIYDEPTSKVNTLWRSGVSLPSDIITILARSRLWERDGELEPTEIDLFNQHIDVIYIPTRLRLAIKISKWFKGIVLFRYFGDLDEGSKDLEELSRADQSTLDRLVLLPIFRSLLEKSFTRRFKNKFILHNYLDPAIVPRRWTGFKSDSPAVVVLGSVHQYKPFQEVLRGLFPLASQIPIKLLGKNVYSLVPKDIRERFNVITDLSREKFFESFFDSQFLIYPHARRYHSHNVPIEAIYGGMPLIFRTQTPTFVENHHSLAERLFPGRIGASHTNRGLMRSALNVYGNEIELRRLTEVQSRLTAPYDPQYVKGELSQLLNFLWSKKDSIKGSQRISVPKEPLPLSSFPAADYFKVRTQIINNGFSAPLVKFFIDHHLNRAKLIRVKDTEELVLEIRPDLKYLQVVLGVIPGGEPVFFRSFTDHKISLTLHGKGFGDSEVVGEIYVNGALVERLPRCRRVSSSHWHTFTEEFNFRRDENSHFVLYLKSSDSLNLMAGSVSHHCGSTEVRC